MRDLVLPLAIMATTIIVALGLITFFRHLLKLRSECAPEVVNAVPAPTKTARSAEPAARHDLAA